MRFIFWCGDGAKESSLATWASHPWEVFKGDFQEGQSALEEKQLFKALPFTLQRASPACPFSHIRGGIR